MNKASTYASMLSMLVANHGGAMYSWWCHEFLSAQQADMLHSVRPCPTIYHDALCRAWMQAE
jgi:hypothetical protein